MPRAALSVGKAGYAEGYRPSAYRPIPVVGIYLSMGRLLRGEFTMSCASRGMNGDWHQEDGMVYNETYVPIKMTSL
jgi:hypothetical protein